ncbi:carboxylesterase [Bifidobacterium eulemuris]|uniref:Carboxylesterase n=1 Tax=Bifidobacterium eulemuris TaxID=1765219 RepID=A0A261G800_9BIFI|nr:carboxylesterase [Bifidobacterium eulemuris]
MGEPSQGLHLAYGRVFSIRQSWVSFACTGVPAADGLPEWEPYTHESGATMLLDDNSELVHHHDQALMSLLAPDYQC